MKKLLIYFLILSSLLMLNSVLSSDLTQQQITHCSGKLVLGGVEKVILMEKNIPIDAKLDTGAAMASLSAMDITTFKREHKIWVRFTAYLPATHKKILYVEPLAGFIRILQRKEENPNQEFNNKKYNVRPVIILSVCMGNQVKPILVNLADRTHFRYPMLLGSDALKKFQVMVDVSQKYLASPHCVKTVI